MPTTTNNGWTIPADTDLVKNGALAIRTLGNAIDTTLGVYSPATPGLVKISGTSFSAVSAVSLPANTFNATYDNYLLTIQLTASVGGTVMSWRGRTSGTDNTGGNYDWRTLFNDASGGGFNVGANNQTSAAFGDAGASRSVSSLDIFNPFAAQPTQILAKTYVNDGNGYQKLGGSQFDTTTSFDALSFFPASGTITGSYVVYGYNK